MRLKKFFCMVMALLTVLSCLGTSAAAEAAIDKDISTVMRATGEFNMIVPANASARANSSFPLEVGEVVTIKASYSPFSASVSFGLIAPDGLFYGLNATNGSFDRSIEVTQRGYYTLAVRNNSSVAVSVSGFVNY